MDAKTFGQAFEHSRHPSLLYADNANFMRSSRAWSERFGNIVLGVLAGTPPCNDQTMEKTVESYQTWIGTTFGQNLLNLRKQAHEQQTNSRALSEINYHLMNTVMLSSWLEPSIAPAATNTHRRTAAAMQSQNSLAYIGVENTSMRLELLHNGNLFTRDKDTGSSNFTESAQVEVGATTELDTAITLLDMTKNEPQIVVIPSPGIFEHGRSPGRNSDFIVFDSQRHTSIGIQAKASVRNEDLEKYDDTFVLLLDGRGDLDNLLAVPRDPARPHARQITSWPGLISAHHLLAQKRALSVRDSFKHLPINQRMLIQEGARRVHHQARAASGGSKSRNEFAATRVSRRVKARL